jgi:polar amino acid transport system substrate-binding protein
MLTAMGGVVLVAPGPAEAQAPPPLAEVVKDLAPTGRLRAAINYGNPVLALRDPASGELRGVSVDLARELARRLAVDVTLVPFDAAGKVFEAARTGAWDIAFLAIDPVRAADIAFSPPYVLIEGTYMVPQASALKTIADVDREGVRIAVGRGSAYDLFLTRAITKAGLVRAPTSAAAVELFVRERLEAVAGVRQPLVDYAKTDPSVRVVEGRFMAIEQAMGTPKRRAAGLAYLESFIEEMKAGGLSPRRLHGIASRTPPSRLRASGNSGVSPGAAAHVNRLAALQHKPHIARWEGDLSQGERDACRQAEEPDV